LAGVIMMDFSRNERIAEEIKKVISQIISNDLKDPRIDGLISVTKVDVTKDLRHATIYISLYGDKKKKDTTFEVINNAKGYIRRELASKIRIKYIPEISFKMDKSIEYAIHINKLLEEVNNQDQGEKEGN
jgi:ribosome-binding factor A